MQISRENNALVYRNENGETYRLDYDPITGSYTDWGRLKKG